jgi:hypothetical protein
VGQFKIGIEKSQQQFRDCQGEMNHYQQQIHDLKIVIATNEVNYRETFAMVAEKSKENAYLKNELVSMKQANDSVLDQVNFLPLLCIR